MKTSLNPNVVVQVNAAQFSAPVNNNTAYGVICRLQKDGSSDGYYFRISGTGYYSVIRREGDRLISLLTGEIWQSSPSIKKGYEANVIRVTCNDDQLSFQVNGKMLFEGTDDAFNSGGIGLLGAVYEDNATAEFHYSNLSVEKP